MNRIQQVYFFIIMMCFLFLSHCGSVKYQEMLMLEDVQSELATIDSIPVLKIQPDDILRIEVASRNPQTVVAIKYGTVASSATTGAAVIGGMGLQERYRVDEEGNIYLPFLGAVAAAGKTTIELRNENMTRLTEYLPDASVQVNFLNCRETVLGEVNMPNTYIIPNERLTILEAIGMAGDFTPYARRNAVLVIRHRSDVREFGRINTQDKTLFKSPYFYLSPNDIVYVKPLKAKQYATQGDFLQRYSFIILPVITLVTFALGTRF